MSDAVIDEFLKASIEERARLALDRRTAPILEAFLGRQAYEEYKQIASKVIKIASREHLASVDKNLIFIPGVMGSQLMSSELGGVWWIDARTRNHLDDLRLNSEGTDSAKPEHRVKPFTTDPSYEPFRAAILERDDFGHVVFPYDWRMSLSRSTTALRDMIFHLFNSNGGKKVHLVAHSMGGLLVRAALADYAAELQPKLGRIVFIATPHYGSPAIAGYLKNHLWGWEMMALLGAYLSRQTFRSLWGVLELLPAPSGTYPGTEVQALNQWRPSNHRDRYNHPCANFDLYRAEDWNLDISTAEKADLQRLLNGVAAFHLKLHRSHLALDQDLRDRMAIIAGVGLKTLFRLEYDDKFFGLWENTKKVTTRIPGNPHRDGDGRVPVASATLPHIAQIRYFRGEHGELPSVPAVYEDVFRWLNRQQMQLSSTPQGALGDHLAGVELVSGAPHLIASPVERTDPEDPGYLRDENFTQEKMMVLKTRLENGEMPSFNRLHIL